MSVIDETHAQLVEILRRGITDTINRYPNDLPDRLEAAHKRELAASGDAAKLREALVQCELFLGNVSRHGHPTLNPGDKCTACDGVEALRGMVVAALAAPARNCDIMDAFGFKVIFAERLDANLKCLPDSARELAKNIAVAVVDTLYAPNAPAEEGAADVEKEGGNDGN